MRQTTVIGLIGLEFSPNSSNNIFRRNTARGNGGEGCTNPPGNSDFCDNGVHNDSQGDNWMPDQL